MQLTHLGASAATVSNTSNTPLAREPVGIFTVLPLAHRSAHPGFRCRRSWVPEEGPDAGLSIRRSVSAPGGVRTDSVGARAPRTCRVGRALYQPLRVALAVLVGGEGFEPPTSCSQSRRSARLS